MPVCFPRVWLLLFEHVALPFFYCFVNYLLCRLPIIAAVQVSALDVYASARLVRPVQFTPCFLYAVQAPDLHR
jgi:hypothetical protein